MRANAMPDLVRRLLTLEAEEGENIISLLDASDRVFSKMRAHLSKRIGQAGFRTLLVRALALTKTRFPSLQAVQIEENGSFAGPRGGIESPEAAAALLASLLGLLVTFIGEDLTLRTLSAIWPELDGDGVLAGESEKP